MNRIAALAGALLIASACGGDVPTAPTLPPPAETRLALTCDTPTLLAGDTAVCKATLGPVNVGLSRDGATVWTSSDPKIATSLGGGLFRGKSDGQTTLTATYSGQSVSAPLTVHLQDVIRATAATSQGAYKVGTTATLWLMGFYGVASADSGTLTLAVTDQTGATVSTSAPLTVPRGGDSYQISATFTIPTGTTRVCRTGVLHIGSTTLTVVPVASLLPCISIVP